MNIVIYFSSCIIDDHVIITSLDAPTVPVTVMYNCVIIHCMINKKFLINQQSISRCITVNGLLCKYVIKFLFFFAEKYSYN